MQLYRIFKITDKNLKYVKINKICDSIKIHALVMIMSIHRIITYELPISKYTYS